MCFADEETRKVESHGLGGMVIRDDIAGNRSTAPRGAKVNLRDARAPVQERFVGRRQMVYRRCNESPRSIISRTYICDIRNCCRRRCDDFRTSNNNNGQQWNKLPNPTCTRNIKNRVHGYKGFRWV